MFFSKVLNLAVALLVFAALNVVASPVAVGNVTHIGRMTVKGPIVPGGPNHTFTGTWKQIDEQIIAAGGSLDFVAKGPAQHNTVLSNITETKNLIWPVTCNMPWIGGTTDFDSALKAFQDLQAHSNMCCSATPGPRVCTQLSCDPYQGGATLCNDRTDAICPNCGYLAVYIDNIIALCSGDVDTRFTGQQFDTDNYNVVVAGIRDCEWPDN